MSTKIIEEIVNLIKTNSLSVETPCDCSGLHEINNHMIRFQILRDYLVLSVMDKADLNMLQIAYYDSSCLNNILYIRNIRGGWESFGFERDHFGKLLLMIFIVLMRHKIITQDNIFSIFKRYRDGILFTA